MKSTFLSHLHLPAGPRRRIGFSLSLIATLILALFLPLSLAQAYSGYPTFDIVSVKPDESVTIKVVNLPPNQTFTVRMGKIGTRAIGGIEVGQFTSGSGGTQTLTYNIPAGLKGLRQISIRMDSKPGGYFAYNWFYNTTTATATPGPTKTPGPTPTPKPTLSGYTGIPTFTILSVVADDKVTIRTHNFPANQTFTVRMGKYGTKGIGGIVVGSSDSGKGGALEFTYTIPAELKGQSRIAIRLDSPAGFYAFNWFWNNTYP